MRAAVHGARWAKGPECQPRVGTEEKETMMPDDSGSKKPGVHPDVLKLGLVSFLTDLSPEMIFAVFAVFFTTIAGASAALLGLIEGCADLAASSLNYLSGWLLDRTGKRKVFALAGYGFSTLAKLILLVSSSVAGLGMFRVIERLGKSFRWPISASAFCCCAPTMPASPSRTLYCCMPCSTLPA